jgi:hypothetical protein
MALKIPVPEAAYAENQFSLGGINYRFVFRFNDRDNRWRVDIYINEDPVKLGLKVIQNIPLLSRYLLDDFTHGEIFCIKMKDTTEPVGRDNLGIGKSYELIYMTYQELAALS